MNAEQRALFLMDKGDVSLTLRESLAEIIRNLSAELAAAMSTVEAQKSEIERLKRSSGEPA